MNRGEKTTRSANLSSESYGKSSRGGAFDAYQAERFESLVSRYGERLIQSLAVIFLDRALAEDAAQEAFVQLYLHWDDVTKRGDPQAWLYRVAVNKCKDFSRGLARASRLFQRLADASPTEVNAEDWTPSGEFMGILRTLPTRQRAAAALYYSADFSVAEIAAVMGISEGSVNSHLHRARVALKQILEAE